MPPTTVCTVISKPAVTMKADHDCRPKPMAVAIKIAPWRKAALSFVLALKMDSPVLEYLKSFAAPSGAKKTQAVVRAAHWPARTTAW